MSSRRWLFVPVLVLVGCGGPVLPDDAGGGNDGSTSHMDAASTICASDGACSDGLFCNGAERCAPDASGADENGCVAGSPACTASETCDEDSDSCAPACGHAPDADGDGHDNIDCGGDDCDDEDANNYPGNLEVCDGAGHDEDCNPDSYGSLDADGDGVIAATCCNGTNCGGDCDDGNSNINPGAHDGPPACDGLDNDCSGTADEGCVCMEGLERECGTDPMLGRLGICRPGTQFCTSSGWGETCVGGVHPAEEICDTLDNDCDGTADEGVLRTYYADADGDGYGVSDMTTQACSPPVGWASAPGDCDDTAAGVSPRASEVCNAIDDNCDTRVDEGLTHTYERDADGDGYGDPTTSMTACYRPDGYTDDATDCDDSAGAVHPGVAEVCDGVDNDCDSSIDPGCSCTDGATRACGSSSTGECTMGTQRCVGGTWGECVGAIEPRTETCNTLDDDCDGTADDGALLTFYADTDGDGFGDATTTMRACSAPPGYSALSTDCDDTRGAVNPGASDRCNGVDDDCDGTTDPGCECTSGTTRSCGTTSTGECSFGTQRCVDGLWGECVGVVDPRTESCNGLDDDCDGMTDEGVQNTYYRDADGDAFGTASTTTAACSQPPGYSVLSTDCNDTNAAINPASVERCNGVDDNCAMGSDEGCSCTDGATRSCGTSDGAGGYVSAGECTVGTQLCIAGAWGGCVGAIAPATETCNGLDDDCDGSTDEGTRVSCYADGDLDGYGSGAQVMVCQATGGGCPSGYSATGGTGSADCNDGNAAIHPGAAEACNGIDDDCDGSSDEGTRVSCYVDADSDAYGGGSAVSVCPSATGGCPASYTATGGGASADCNDGNAAINPGETELCNGVDDDCNGSTDEGTRVSCFVDTDGDGYGNGSALAVCAVSGACPSGYSATGSGVNTDCNDGSAAIHPGASETCNGIDDDCDGSTDEGTRVSCYVDADADGYGSGGLVSVCAVSGACPSGYTSTGGASADCNDSNGAIHPGATETCNGVDDDCSSDADDGSGMICVLGTSRADTGAFGTCSAVAGVYTCASGCTSEIFTAAPPSETCNGADDDCDGAADDGFLCVRSSTGNACTTSCGTPGSRSCNSSCSAFTTCTGSEVCNGCDDDGDGTRDDGFACVQGTSRSCTTGCGTSGTQSCRADCGGYESCRAPSEVCNGCDDDLNGAADDGFACEQGSVEPCLTACGTVGQRTCNATCTGYAGVGCAATTESCNYCDDDGDGTFTDEIPFALASTRAQPACPDLTASSVSSACASVGGAAAEIGLVAAPSDAGAAWITTSRQVGNGTITVKATMYVARNAAGRPQQGWAVVFDRRGSAAGSVGNPMDAGVPLDRDGFAIEWLYEQLAPPATGSIGDDGIYIRQLNGTSMAGMPSLLGAVPSGVPYRLDPATPVATRVKQVIVIEYTPDDPNTGVFDEYLTVTVGDGTTWTTIYDGSDIFGMDPGDVTPRQLNYGDPLYVGFTAGSLVSNGTLSDTSATLRLGLEGGPTTSATYLARESVCD